MATLSLWCEREIKPSALAVTYFILQAKYCNKSLCHLLFSLCFFLLLHTSLYCTYPFLSKVLKKKIKGCGRSFSSCYFWLLIVFDTIKNNPSCMLRSVFSTKDQYFNIAAGAAQFLF